MTNFDNLKIQTFSNINDQLRAPTATKAGNASHLINRFNSLVELTKNEITKLDSTDQQIISTLDQAISQNNSFGLSFGFHSNALVEPTKVNNVSGIFPQNSGMRLLFSSATHYCIDSNFWISYENRFIPLSCSFSGIFPNSTIDFDYYVTSRESYPGTLFDNFDIFSYSSLQFGIGSDLNSINTTIPGIHASVNYEGNRSGSLHFYSNYLISVPFIMQIYTFSLPSQFIVGMPN